MGKGKGKGKSYEPEPYWGPPSKAQSHRVPAPVDVDLQQNLLSFGMTLDPKNIAIKHRKHLREVLEWMSIGLALGRKRAPADGDSGVSDVKIDGWKFQRMEANFRRDEQAHFWCVIQKTCFLYAITLPETNGLPLKMSGWKTTFTFGMA